MGHVREDYSADGNAWDYLPHDHARSRAYRWGEDGLAGFCDIEQRLCLGLALWNGRDPILKERAFGLTGPQGNHGEDVKEYWWYLDGVPSHSWNRWRYHYPQAAFPYEDLIETNASRGRYQPEYELLDTGVFDDDRYWITEVHYTKAGPDDILMTVQLTNAGPEADTVHVLPTVWFRNTWGWGTTTFGPACARPGPFGRLDHPFVGAMELIARPDRTAPTRSCSSARTRRTSKSCTEQTRSPRIRRTASTITSSTAPQRSTLRHRHQMRVLVPGDRARRPDGRTAAAAAARRGGTPAAARCARRGLRAGDDRAPGGGRRVLPELLRPRQRRRGHGAPAGMRGHVVEQAAVLLRRRPLVGRRPGQPAAAHRAHPGRNSKWRNFDGFDIISMPDKWEYPGSPPGTSPSTV